MDSALLYCIALCQTLVGGHNLDSQRRYLDL